MAFLEIFPQESFISMLGITMKVKFKAAISENRALERKCHISFDSGNSSTLPDLF